MWSETDVEIELDDVDDEVVFLKITTPVGLIEVCEVCGEVLWVGRVLYVNNAHVQGLRRGDLLRVGLNAIGRKLLEIADVDKIVIQGANRTTGRRAGSLPQTNLLPPRLGSS